MSEADDMWQNEMAQLGGDFDAEDPTHEVITGKKQKVIFTGSRRACWAFRRLNGGFVREYTGEGEDTFEEYRL